MGTSYSLVTGHQAGDHGSDSSELELPCCCTLDPCPHHCMQCLRAATSMPLLTCNCMTIVMTTHHE